MSYFDDQLHIALEQRKADQGYRQRYVTQSSPDAHIHVDHQEYLAFCSNDYLGLASHPYVTDCFQKAASQSVGSGASHLVYGHHQHHHQLEQDIARFTGRERAVLFSTGYMANMGVITALVGKGDSIYEDRLNHASLIDAGLLSRAQLRRYRHNDMEQLACWLEQDHSPRKLVVVDGVFSMDGDIAPLPALVELCQRYDAQLMVDDAHGFGVLGDHGGGCAEHFDLSTEQLPILVGTLGKAFGTFGAFVAGSEALIETLIQFARTYIYTTALPPAVAAATSASLVLLQDNQYREQLHRNIHYFRQQAGALNLPLLESNTPIQPIVLGDSALVMSVANTLKQQGILVGAIRPPTVPEGTARLRITLNALHSFDHIDQLVTALAQALKAECQQEIKE